MIVAIPAVKTETFQLTEDEKKVFTDPDIRRLEAYNSQGEAVAIIYMRQSREGVHRRINV